MLAAATTKNVSVCQDCMAFIGREKMLLVLCKTKLIVVKPMP